MRKILLATSALALLGASAGFAQDLEPMDQPVQSTLEGPAFDSGATAQPAWPRRGFQAADGFMPSDENNYTEPRFAREPEPFDPGAITAGIPAPAPAATFDEAGTIDMANQQALPSDESNRPEPAVSAIPPDVIAYVEQNPTAPVAYQGGLELGAIIPAEVELRPIPENPAYAYVYLDQGPAVIDVNTRTVVWVR
jgi:hypothetical protein